MKFKWKITKKYYYINKNKTLEYNENDHISIEYYSNPTKIIFI